MNAEHDPLRAGACMTLPALVINKYFWANAHTERFEAETARAICVRCIVKALCLTRAIVHVPPDVGVVAGQSANVIKATDELGAG